MFIFRNENLSVLEIKKYSQKIFFALVITACFSIMLPTAFLSIAFGSMLLFWLIAGDYKKKLFLIIKYPALLTPAILGSLYLIGLFFSTAPFLLSLKFFLKYLKLLLIPIIASSIQTEKIRVFAVNAFISAVLITLAASYFKYLHIIPMNLHIHDRFLETAGGGYYLFKGSIAHGILMSFAMYMMIIRAYFNSKFWWKLTWAILAFFTFCDVMFLGYGRTGQVIAIGLLILSIFQLYNYKILFRLIISFTALILLANLLSLNLQLPPRINQTIKAIQDGDRVEKVNKLEPRYMMYINTMKLIKKSPIFGYGTGSLSTEYSKLTKDDDIDIKFVPNPHNQYLLTQFELGFFGFLLLITMFIKQWQLSNNLIVQNDYYNYYAKGLIFTMAIGCLFNSLIIDATEGKFYCILMGVFLSACVAKQSKKNSKL